ncbi:MAG: DUF262 domain-containing protein [Cytophagales bacterium]|nr:DUF262 domain-containing protein [Cytophagales bacterium]
MSSTINSNTTDVGKVFGFGPFHIAFYQRDYEWGGNEVRLLLDDIFGQFDKGYEIEGVKNSSKPKEDVEKISPYFLNTFITNKKRGNEYVVDGQQRLTTLLLIFMVLYRILKDVSGDRKKWKNLYDTVGSHISKMTTEGKKFPIRHDRPNEKPHEGEDLLPHQQTLEDLLEGEWDQSTRPKLEEKAKRRGPTSENMVKNYGTIHEYLGIKFQNGKDEHRLEMFFYYYTNRVLLTQLIVDFVDTPMVFEAVNDRGKHVPDYEILKGKLLGRLDPEEVYGYLDIWEKSIKRLQGLQDPDAFFRFLFAGRYIKSQTNYKDRVPGKVYHREFLIKPERKDPPEGLITDSDEIKDFLKKDLVFYTGLVQQIQSSEYPFFDFSDSSWSLLFGAIHSRKYSPNVFESDSKDLEDIRMQIRSLSFERKRLETLREVQGIGIDIPTNIYAITRTFREKEGKWSPKDLRDFIDERLKESLNKSDVQDKDLIFSDKRFIVEDKDKDRFHFLRGVDIFLYTQTDLPRDIMWDPGSPSQNKWEREHIIADNDENLDKFEDFWTVRGLLGAQVPLRRKENREASNKSYGGKLKHYDQGPDRRKRDSIWTATLVEKFHVGNEPLKQFKEKKFGDYDFKDLIPYDDFDRNAIEEREKVLCKITRIMWAENTLDDEGYPQTAIWPGHPGSKQNPRK